MDRSSGTVLLPVILLTISLPGVLLANDAIQVIATVPPQVHVGNTITLVVELKYHGDHPAYVIRPRYLSGQHLSIEIMKDNLPLQPTKISLPGPIVDYNECSKLTSLFRVPTSERLLFRFDISTSSIYSSGPLLVLRDVGRYSVKVIYRNTSRMEDLTAITPPEHCFEPGYFDSELEIWQGVAGSEWQAFDLLEPKPQLVQDNLSQLVDNIQDRSSDNIRRFSETLNYFIYVHNERAMEISKKLIEEDDCRFRLPTLSAFHVLCSHDLDMCLRSYEMLLQCDAPKGVKKNIKHVFKAYSK